ncbi:MAG: hypothetical protein LC099_05475 [Anaerolineales bacterium]|nr:hypothetical protein [Anaerolineales bacterium]
MRRLFPVATLILALLACAMPGAPSVAPLPTFDPNSVQTIIAGTAGVAMTQTFSALPTATQTPTATFTPSVTPTFTPTFIFLLSTKTPLPSDTPSPTMGVIYFPPSGGGGNSNKFSTPDPKADPRKPSGLQWSCVWYGLQPPRHTVFKPNRKFSVRWNLYNSGYAVWGHNSIDFVYTGGYRHDGTKIQDLARDIGPGAEIWVETAFTAPKAPGDYNTYFTLQVGKHQFCSVAYFFTVKE